MSNIKVVQNFIEAMVQRDIPTLQWLLRANACLEVTYGDSRDVYWTRARVRNALLAEAIGWHAPKVTVQGWSINGRSITVDFDVVIRNGKEIERHSRTMSVILEDDKVDMIVLHHDCVPQETQSLLDVSDLPVLMRGKKQVAKRPVVATAVNKGLYSDRQARLGYATA